MSNKNLKKDCKKNKVDQTAIKYIDKEILNIFISYLNAPRPNINSQFHTNKLS